MLSTEVEAVRRARKECEDSRMGDKKGCRMADCIYWKERLALARKDIARYGNWRPIGRLNIDCRRIEKFWR